MAQTFYVYLAHKWDRHPFNFQTPDEWKQWWLSHGHDLISVQKWIDDLMLIKIGETSNLHNRKKTLDRSVKQSYSFEGTLADALFLESYLRTKIQHYYNISCTHYSLDHFYCNNVDTIYAIEDHFQKWCEEGYKILQELA